MAEEKVYYVRIHGDLVVVTKPVYLAYYKMDRQFKTQREKDSRNGLLYYNSLDTDETLGVESIPDTTSPPVENIVICKLMSEKLNEALKQLSSQEMGLIEALYYQGLSEREVSKLTGVPPMTIHDRKTKTLNTIKKLMKG